LEYEGPERRRINRTKTLLLTIWIIGFTTISFWIWHTQRQNINDVKNSKANIVALQHSNCKLKLFILEARHTRVLAAKEDKKIDEAERAAIHSYAQIAKSFSGESTGSSCKIPKRIRLNHDKV
jgi:uncharacterized membrane protein YebE (DUF533 family)